jgi:hypothetical protein
MVEKMSIGIVTLALALSVWALNTSNGVYRAVLPLVAYTGLAALMLVSRKKSARPEGLLKNLTAEGGVFLVGALSVWMFRNQHYALYFSDHPYQGLQKWLVGVWCAGWWLLWPLQNASTRMLRAQNVVALALAGVALAYLGAVILATPAPGTDVFFFQKLGAEALLGGVNPYAIQYPDIYGGASHYYPPGGPSAYPYPPLSLWMTIPGAWFGMDVRWELLFWHLIACAAIGKIARSWRMSLVMLLHPMVPHMIRHSWTEPRLAAAICLAVYSLQKMRKKLNFAPEFLGMALSLKQYAVIWILPCLGWAWFKKKALPVRELLRVAWIPLVSYGAFLLWSPRDLWQDLVVFHMTTPFRPDGLTWNSFAYGRGLGESWIPSWVPWLFSFAIGFWGVCQRARKNSDPSLSFKTGVCTSMLLVFFLTSKHAFVNYFYLIHMMVGVWAALKLSERDYFAAGRSG